jgi:ribosomal protein S18 acetylase RimI-like enzyme
MSQAQATFLYTRLDAMTAADFEALARLAETIWRAHYTGIIGSAQVDYMLAGRYTPEKLRLYLDADDRWLMLLRIDSSTGSRAVGYCSYALTDDHDEMKPGEMKPGVMKPGVMKLEQLYLLPEYYGQGLGRLMMRHVEQQARARGCGTLMLQTNKRNGIAIAFYRKTGFTVREEAVFDIGNGFVMDDYVMEKTL